MDCFESYLFGFVLADGNISLSDRNRGRVYIELNIDDKDILYKFLEKIPYSKIKFRERNTNFKKNYKSAIFINFRKEFRDKLILFGMPTENKSKIGTTPKIDYSKPDFWRGFFDGDGSIGFTKDNEPFISFTISSLELKNQLCQLLLEKFNIQKNIKPNKRDNVYNIVLKNEDAINFCNYMYSSADIYLNRKFEIYQNFKNWKRTKKKVLEKAWTIEEILYIKNHTIEDSMIALNRTKQSIKMKLYRLNKINKI